MSSIKKAEWGKAKKSGVAAATATHQANTGKREPIPLAEVDVSKITFGPVQEGKKGDHFVTMEYDGGRFELSLAEAPDFCRMPFKAGRPMKDGLPLGDQWSTRIELTPTQYDKWLAIEAKLLKEMLPLRDQLYPSKGKKGMSEEMFTEKMNTQVQPPNVEKGYPATIKVTVPHEEGKHPVVELMHLRGDAITRPTPGTIHDLEAKSAVTAIVAPFRGPYFGNQGGGIKLTARHFSVFTNMATTNAPTVNYSKVRILDEDTPTNSAPADKPMGEEGAQDEGSADEGEGQPYTGDQFEHDLAASNGQ